MRAGTPPQDIFADAQDTGYAGAMMGGGSSRHGSGGGASRRRRAGSGTAGEEQYPALVERALVTLLKVRVKQHVPVYTHGW